MAEKCVRITNNKHSGHIYKKGSLATIDILDPRIHMGFALAHQEGEVMQILHCSEYVVVESQKKDFMSRLRDIPNRIKRLLDKGEQAMYEMGWIDSNLEPTKRGYRKMRQLLFEQMRTQIGSEAVSAVAEIKKAEKEAEKK